MVSRFYDYPYRSSSAAPSSTRRSCCTRIVDIPGGRCALPCPTQCSSTSCSTTSTRSPTRRSRLLPRRRLCRRITIMMDVPRTSTRPFSCSRRSKRPCKREEHKHPPPPTHTHHPQHTKPLQYSYKRAGRNTPLRATHVLCATLLTNFLSNPPPNRREARKKKENQKRDE